MGKRGNSEGSLRRRADGRWEARISLTDGKRKSHYADTRQEAAKWLAAAIRDRDKGLPVVPEKATVREFLVGETKPGEENYPGGWLGAIRGTVRPYTFRGYEVYVRAHILPTLGRVQMARLTPQQLQSLYSMKMDEGLSPTTVAHIHATIYHFLDQAMRWGVVLRNVAQLVDSPRRARIEMTALSPEDARALLDVAKGNRLEAFYVLAVTTGMRQGELLGLRWRDVDLAKGTLQVTATLQRTKKDGLVFAEPKTSSSRRQIALTGTAVAALRHHKARQAEERLAAGPEWQDHDVVFANHVGRPIEATNLIRRSFKPLLRKADLPDIRLHDLRHTAATLCLKQRVPPKVVSEMLGHSQVGVTLNIYSHVLPDMQREAAIAMDALLQAQS
ncbi:MAG: tyrosine-type recombinase/integrase [Chloroflexota bacterium]